MAKKYQFEKGKQILDTRLRYVCEGGYKNKHRIIIASCSCGTMRPFRVDHITNGRTKSCGCHVKELIDSGKLTAMALRVKEEKFWLYRGGWNTRNGTICLLIHPQYVENIKNLTINELFGNSL